MTRIKKSFVLEERICLLRKEIYRSIAPASKFSP